MLVFPDQTQELNNLRYEWYIYIYIYIYVMKYILSMVIIV